MSDEVAKLVEDLESAEFARRDAAKSKLLAGDSCVAGTEGGDGVDGSGGGGGGGDGEPVAASTGGGCAAADGDTDAGRKEGADGGAAVEDFGGEQGAVCGKSISGRLAEIAGARWEHADRHGAMAGDAEIMPKDTGIVGQTTGVGIAGFTIDRSWRTCWGIKNR